MRIKVGKVPGKKSKKVLDQLRKLNGGFTGVYPFVHAHKGVGCYFSDIDGNVFLDFASQIASNPLGYNHPALNKVVQNYSKHPVKYGGQDFTIPEHLDMLKTLLGITPNKLNAAFLINSGAEAVENAIKVALHNQPAARFGVSFMGGFHGRTLGALSCTDSKAVQKKDFWTFPMHRLPFNEDAVCSFERLLLQEADASNIGFVIVEAVQGEGGYRVANKKWYSKVRKMCAKNNIPFIADEVQAGVGRTGKWWAHQHMGVVPDIMSCAKALQVGATVSKRSWFPASGAMSSTWGAGHSLDLAMGMATVNIIKKERLLARNTKMGKYLRSRLVDAGFLGVRGLGLMCAFDLPSVKIRDDFIVGMLQAGVVVLGCGMRSVRVIPPYVVSSKDIDVFVEVARAVFRKVSSRGFSHKGEICKYADCGRVRN